MLNKEEQDLLQTSKTDDNVYSKTTRTYLPVKHENRFLSTLFFFFNGNTTNNKATLI